MLTYRKFIKSDQSSKSGSLPLLNQLLELAKDGWLRGISKPLTRSRTRTTPTCSKPATIPSVGPALSHFDDYDPECDTEQAFATVGHVIAPLATYTILAGTKNNLGNGWERSTLPESGHIGLFDRENGSIHLLTPPGFGYSRRRRGSQRDADTPTVEVRYR